MPTGPRLVEALVNDIVDRQQLAIDNRTNPIDKCQDALDAAGRPRLNIGSGTGQTFDVARRLRNALVHYTQHRPIPCDRCTRHTGTDGRCRDRGHTLVAPQRVLSIVLGTAACSVLANWILPG
jgi:hypothetical protein